MTEEQIVGECLKYPCKYVVLSGGEPLIQPVKQLIEQLWINGFKIDVETNGSIYKHLPWVETIVLSPKVLGDPNTSVSLNVVVPGVLK